MGIFDSFFFRQYDRQRYNCLHFTVEVWKDYLGLDISGLLPKVRMRKNGTFELISLPRDFQRIARPLSPCLSIYRTHDPRELHIGSFIGGRVLHITDSGVYHLPPEVMDIGYKSVKYYELLNHNQH